MGSTISGASGPSPPQAYVRPPAPQVVVVPRYPAVLPPHVYPNRAMAHTYSRPPQPHYPFYHGPRSAYPPGYPPQGQDGRYSGHSREYDDEAYASPRGSGYEDRRHQRSRDFFEDDDGYFDDWQHSQGRGTNERHRSPRQHDYWDDSKDERRSPARQRPYITFDRYPEYGDTWRLVAPERQRHWSPPKLQPSRSRRTPERMPHGFAHSAPPTSPRMSLPLVQTIHAPSYSRQVAVVPLHYSPPVATALVHPTHMAMPTYLANQPVVGYAPTFHRTIVAPPTVVRTPMPPVNIVSPAPPSIPQPYPIYPAIPVDAAPALNYGLSGYEGYRDELDPYEVAGVGPGGTVYDTHNNIILAPDALTATMLDAQDGTIDGSYFGTKIKVKRPRRPLAPQGYSTAAEYYGYSGRAKYTPPIAPYGPASLGHTYLTAPHAPEGFASFYPATYVVHGPKPNSTFQRPSSYLAQAYPTKPTYLAEVPHDSVQRQAHSVQRYSCDLAQPFSAVHYPPTYVAPSHRDSQPAMDELPRTYVREYVRILPSTTTYTITSSEPLEMPSTYINEAYPLPTYPQAQYTAAPLQAAGPGPLPDIFVSTDGDLDVDTLTYLGQVWGGLVPAYLPSANDGRGGLGLITAKSSVQPINVHATETFTLHQFPNLSPREAFQPAPQDYIMVSPQMAGPQISVPPMAAPQMVSLQMVAPQMVSPQMVAPQMVTPRMVVSQMAAPQMAAPAMIDAQLPWLFQGMPNQANVDQFTQASPAISSMLTGIHVPGPALSPFYQPPASTPTDILPAQLSAPWIQINPFLPPALQQLSMDLDTDLEYSASSAAPTLPVVLDTSPLLIEANNDHSLETTELVELVTPSPLDPATDSTDVIIVD